MYQPRHFLVSDLDEIGAFVQAVGAADLVTLGADLTPESTLAPVIWDRPPSDRETDGGAPFGRLLAHVARANEQWRSAHGARGLAIVHGPGTYISPSWYAAKAEHGRVVPTWNYDTVHFSGTVEVIDDVEAVLSVVRRLTDRHEADAPSPWSVDDAPDQYVLGQARAIVAIVLHVDRVEAKSKMSQNRSETDREGVVDGLRARGHAQDLLVADAVENALRAEQARGKGQ